MPVTPTMTWGGFPKWGWTEDENPGAGGTEYAVEITADKVAWSYSEDRWGRSEEQSHADFAEFGPLWETPKEILDEMAGHFGISGRPWQEPGYRDYSPAWWAVYFSKPNAVELAGGEDARRRYHGQRTLLMLAAEKNATPVMERLL